MTTRAKLIDYLREQAAWRDQKADEYPDDPRNSHAASRLRDLAAEVERLPEDTPALLVLDSIQSEYDHDRFLPSEESARLIGQYGFQYPPHWCRPVH